MTRHVCGGLAASLAHPGGNLSGIYQLTSKRIEVLKELLPSLSR